MSEAWCSSAIEFAARNERGKETQTESVYRLSLALVLCLARGLCLTRVPQPEVGNRTVNQRQRSAFPHNIQSLGMLKLQTAFPTKATKAVNSVNHFEMRKARTSLDMLQDDSQRQREQRSFFNALDCHHLHQDPCPISNRPSSGAAWHHYR